MAHPLFAPQSGPRDRFPIPVRGVLTTACNFWFTGDPIACWTHYVQTGVDANERPPRPIWRTVPCLGDDCTHCGACAAEKRSYAPVVVWVNNPSEPPAQWVPIVLDVSQAVGIEWEAHRMKSGTLRGWIASMRRRKGRYSVIDVNWLECKEVGLPASFDVKPILLNMWRKWIASAKDDVAKMRGDILQLPTLHGLLPEAVGAELPGPIASQQTTEAPHKPKEASKRTGQHRSEDGPGTLDEGLAAVIKRLKEKMK